MSTRDARGRWEPGKSGNPAGVQKKAKDPAGSIGIFTAGGRIQDGERNPKLIGREKWTTFANSYNRPPVAIARLLRNALLSSVKWSLTENEAGGADAKRGLEIVEQGLLRARLPRPWNRVVAKAGNGEFFEGFSIHATALGRRKDGLVTFTNIEHRPQHTIDKWLRDTIGTMFSESEAQSGPFVAVQQQLPSGQHERIPLEECLYLANDDIGDSPEGVGVLRLIADRIRKVEDEEALELDEMFSSMGGTPIIRVPLEEIVASAPKDPAKRDAYIAEQTAKYEEFVANRIKTPSKRQWFKLDSKTYEGQDPNTISNIQKWGIEIIKGEVQGLAEIRKSITDEDLNIARILGVEFVFVGGGDSAGSYGMHESKVGVFAAALQSSNDRVAIAARDQLGRRLVAANGLDPDTATPTFVPEPITIGQVLEAAQALALIQGLQRNDPARNIIRQRYDLPPEPEEDDGSLMAPRAPLVDTGGVANKNPPAPAAIAAADPPPQQEPKKP